MRTALIYSCLSKGLEMVFYVTVILFRRSACFLGVRRDAAGRSSGRQAPLGNHPRARAHAGNRSTRRGIRSRLPPKLKLLPAVSPLAGSSGRTCGFRRLGEIPVKWEVRVKRAIRLKQIEPDSRRSCRRAILPRLTAANVLFRCRPGA